MRLRPVRSYYLSALLPLLGAPAFAQEAVSIPGRLHAEPVVSADRAFRKARAVEFQLPSSLYELSPSPEVLLEPLPDADHPVRQARAARAVGRIRALDPGVAPGSGAWTTLPDGRALWRLTLRSQDAQEVRIHFEQFQVGNGKVWIYGVNGDAVQEFTAGGVFGDGDFWTGTVSSDRITIEYAPESGAAAESLPFRIASIAHMWTATESLPAPESLSLAPSKPGADSQRSALGLTAGGQNQLAACHLDIACYSDYQRMGSGVARIVFAVGPYMSMCTAALVNTRSGIGTPLMLTANHCIDNEASARSVQANFFFESSACGSSQLRTVENTLGANYMVSGSFSKGDFSLIRLLELPRSPVYFFGLTTAEPAIGSRLAGIHHPEGSYKRISFGTRVPDETTFVADLDGIYYSPSDLFYQVDQREGRTQPGSSGSPLLNDRNQIVGTLSSGPIFSLDPAEDEVLLCQAKEVIDQYGRVSKAFTALQPYVEDLRPALMVSHRSGDQFTGPRVRLQWSPGIGAREYRLEVGKTRGGSEYASVNGTETSAEIESLPVDGSTVFARLSTRLDSGWQSVDYTFLASGGGAPRPAVLVAPQAGSVLEDSAEFRWDGGVDVDQYMFQLGSVPGGADIFQSGAGSKATSATVTGLPADGRTLYATVLSLVSGEWRRSSAVYTAVNRQSKNVTLRIANRLAYPVAVLVNERSAGSAAAMATTELVVPRTASLQVGWRLVRPTHPQTALPLGENLGEDFAAVAPGDAADYEITNTVKGVAYFTPVVANASTVTHLVEVNAGTSARAQAGPAAPGVALGMGYYKLLPASTVRGYWTGLGYTGAYASHDNVAGTAEPGSGVVRVRFNQPGASSR